jgi:hypothetical protein
VSSDAAPCERILGETGAGVVFRSMSASSLATMLERLLDPAQRRTLGAAGRQAILGRYNWEYDAGIFLEVVAKI